MNTLYQTLLATAAGTLVIAGGVAFNSTALINEARRVANQANMHQLATVLEIYYLDHAEYPQVEGGEALVETLYDGGYLRTKPLEAAAFTYEPIGAEDYRLNVADVPLATSTETSALDGAEQGTGS